MLKNVVQIGVEIFILIKISTPFCTNAMLRLRELRLSGEKLFVLVLRVSSATNLFTFNETAYQKAINANKRCRAQAVCRGTELNDSIIINHNRFNNNKVEIIGFSTWFPQVLTQLVTGGQRLDHSWSRSISFEAGVYRAEKNLCIVGGSEVELNVDSVAVASIFNNRTVKHYDRLCYIANRK